MFIPLHDGMPMRRIPRPLVTWALITANIVVYAVTTLRQAGELTMAAALEFGVIPAVLTGQAMLTPELAGVPVPVTLVTSLFVHANFVHILGNMLFLWVFGDNVEDAMGHTRFLAFYLACGVVAALAHVASDFASQQPLIGASGAVSGVIAAYLLLHPRALIWGLFIKAIPLRVRAFWAIGAWVLFQIGAAFLAEGTNVGFFAHLGGLAAGFALTRLLVARDVQLFERIP